jgi:hypothetical protein
MFEQIKKIKKNEKCIIVLFFLLAIAKKNNKKEVQIKPKRVCS